MNENRKAAFVIGLSLTTLSFWGLGACLFIRSGEWELTYTIGAVTVLFWIAYVGWRG
jgi:hypothetical protein